jgi:hypothetical protein
MTHAFYASYVDEVFLDVNSSIPKLFRLPPNREAGAAPDATVTGDSGGPCFVFYKGEPVLLGHFWDGPLNGTVGGMAFYSAPIVFDYINDQMTLLGGGYHLAPIQF